MTFETAKWEMVGRFIVSGTVAFAFVGCIAMLFLLTWYKIDIMPGVREVLCVLIGVLGREFGDVVYAWIGNREPRNESDS